MLSFLLPSLFMNLSLAALPSSPHGYFKIMVKDEQTGRGVPLVELNTINNLDFITDSNGLVAFHEPGMMDQTVFFSVKSHGYEFPKDGFGFRGKALKVIPGGSASLSLKRLNVAERLYRVTGGGIYADSQLLGAALPLRRPILNGLVLGQDSVQQVLYRGRIYWFWGDTNRPSYPLGNFHMPGATSLLPSKGGLDPAVGVDLDYFLDDKGFVRPTAPMPGPGPTWLGGLVVLGEEPSHERLFAVYAKIRPPMETYERGLVEFDDAKKEFRKIRTYDLTTPLYPQGHSFFHKSAGVNHVYFANPYPVTRVRADADSLVNLPQYEGFTCLEEGTRPEKARIDRPGGKIRYAWRKNTPGLGPAEQAKLIRQGKLKPDEALLALRDVESGQAVTAHSGSVNWNPYRRRWVMISLQIGGSSFLGEVWYAEADTPVGPWVYARKIVTHDRYSFYNPKHHPLFDQAGGRLIYFEGTYAQTFSGNPVPTPRYDYNQIMYRLDLSDPRLVLPVPIYLLSQKNSPESFGTIHALSVAQNLAPAFFALDRPVKGTIPIYSIAEPGGGRRLTSTGQTGSRPIFYAFPNHFRSPAPTTTPLFEFVNKGNNQLMYTIDPNWVCEGFQRRDPPLCLVWPNPTQVVIEQSPGNFSKIGPIPKNPQENR